MRQFFCPHIPSVGECAQLDELEAHHLVSVLRAYEGMEVGLMNGQGVTAVASVVGMRGKKSHTVVDLRIEQRVVHSKPKMDLCLYVACPRTVALEFVIRQATELGVNRIVPMITEFTVAKPSDLNDKWLVAAQEAMKQSTNPWLPEISAPMLFREAIKSASPLGWVGAVPREEVAPITLDSSLSTTFSVWIGPEGGFSTTELDQLFDRSQRTYQALTVGPYILRLETAVVAVLSRIVLP